MLRFVLLSATLVAPGLIAPAFAQSALNGDWNGYSPDFGNHPSWHTHAEGVPRDGLPFSAAVGIGPYTAIILSQD